MIDVRSIAAIRIVRCSVLFGIGTAWCSILVWSEPCGSRCTNFFHVWVRFLLVIEKSTVARICHEKEIVHQSMESDVFENQFYGNKTQCILQIQYIDIAIVINVTSSCWWNDEPLYHRHIFYIKYILFPFISIIMIIYNIPYRSLKNYIRTYIIHVPGIFHRYMYILLEKTKVMNFILFW